MIYGRPPINTQIWSTRSSSIKCHQSICCLIWICATDMKHTPTWVHREQSALGTSAMWAHRRSSEVQFLRSKLSLVQKSQNGGPGCDPTYGAVGVMWLWIKSFSAQEKYLLIFKPSSTFFRVFFSISIVETVTQNSQNLAFGGSNNIAIAGISKWKETFPSRGDRWW